MTLPYILRENIILKQMDEYEGKSNKCGSYPLYAQERYPSYHHNPKAI